MNVPLAASLSPRHRSGPAVTTLIALLAAAGIARAPAARAKSAPKPNPTATVVTLQPPHLSVELDATTVEQLVVTFDRAMNQRSHSLCGGGPSFPKVLHTSWRDDRTFVATVELLANRVYTMEVSCAAAGGFHGADGTRVPPAPWRFATRGDKFADGAAAAALQRLFRAIHENYSYRDRLGIDWLEFERQHLEHLLASPDAPALALRLAEALAVAQDSHVTVRWQDAVLPTWRRDVVANFDLRGVQKSIGRLSRAGGSGLVTRTADGIGYLFVGSFAREQRDDFDRVLEAVRTLLDCKALILDVRGNTGGDELLARRLAAFFVTGDKEYAAQRVRDPRAPNGFREREVRVIRGNTGNDVFAGEVAVLTGPLVMSSAEAFLLMMKQAPRAVLIGSESYGSSGNPQPHVLLEGLTVWLPSWQAMRPDGSMFEGEGISPHIHVAATPQQLVDGDPILAEALQRLRSKR